MQGQINPKIVGASAIGFAMVLGAFVISSHLQPTLPASTQTPTTPAIAIAARAPIAVTDNDNNGIEDWRDEFVTAKPVRLTESANTYSPPDTLTGQMSIDFFQDLVRSKYQGPFGPSREEVLSNTVTKLATETEVTLYDTPDIDIIKNWEENDILNYANTVAATINHHNSPELNADPNTLHSIITAEDKSRVAEIEKIAKAYENLRDDTLLIPVPLSLAKEHLDLINTYHAMYEDLHAMALMHTDPAVSLLRIKRYQDDQLGVAYAFQNLYTALEPYAYLLSADDPALLFAIFNPDYQQ